MCMLFSRPLALWCVVVYVVSHEVYLSVYSVYEWTMLLAVVKVEASARWEAPANSLAPNGCEEDLALATSTRALSPSCYSTAQRRSRVVAVEPEGVGPCGRTFLSTTIIYPAYLTIFKPPSVQRYSGAAKFGRRRVMTIEGRFSIICFLMLSLEELRYHIQYYMRSRNVYLFCCVLRLSNLV